MTRTPPENAEETQGNLAPTPNESANGSRGAAAGRNAKQDRQAGRDDPKAEGSRMGRERYKDDRGTVKPGDPAV